MMMKKLLALLVFATAAVNAQYSVKGTMTPPEKNDWVMLHKLEGVKPIYVTNTTIKFDTVVVGGDKQALGRFAFQLPKGTKPGVYRATYRNTGAGFVDFIFNNENVEFIFNPKVPEQSVVFTSSRENKLQGEYNNAYAEVQRKLDSLLVEYIKSPTKDTKKAYKKVYKELEELQEGYENKTEGMLVHHFIKASARVNGSSVFDNMQEYLDFTVENFFKNVNFGSKELYNSSFFLDRINDYVFYLNVSEDPATQLELYKKSVKDVFSKISDKKLKKEVTIFLINSFTDKRNGEMVDWLFAEYYDKLPSADQDSEYKKERLNILLATVGRIAPDFSWKEGETEYKLSTLNDGNKYLLVFWSTGCPHCVKEVPELYEFMKNRSDVSVISFGIENEDARDLWKEFTSHLSNWHNAIGTHPDYKFDNETVRKYNLLGTPSYFVLDKNKKIIAMPDQLDDIKNYFKN